MVKKVIGDPVDSDRSFTTDHCLLVTDNRH